MRPTSALLLVAAVVVGGPLLLLLAIANGPWLAWKLSPVLSRPPGLPKDAVATYDFLAGTTWQFCRNLPSGRAISTPRGIVLEYGRRCGAPVNYTYEPPVSLDSPQMRVIEPGSISFSVPERPVSELMGPCPFAFTPNFLRRARTLIDEAARVPELAVVDRRALGAAQSNISQFSSERARMTGASFPTYFCELEVPGRRTLRS